MGRRQRNYCSFCGRPEGDVDLVLGPGEVAICGPCIAKSAAELAKRYEMLRLRLTESPSPRSP